MGDEFHKWPAQKPAPEPAPDRTSWAQKASAEFWSSVTDPAGRLRFYAARLARLDRSRLDAFRAEVGAVIRETDPKVVLDDPHVVGMVRELFGERGVMRLREKVR
jgi:hypothetical protein